MTATVRPHGDRLRRLIAYGTTLNLAMDKAYERGDTARFELLLARFESAGELYREMKAHHDRPVGTVP